MGLYDDKLLPYLIGLENTIETHDEEMTSDIIIQSKERLHSILLRLNRIQNSKLSINRLPGDILYNIFALIVQSSPGMSSELSSGMTVVKLSSVCRRWRICALGWPTLWAYLDIPSSHRFVELLISRSEDVPLKLRWTNPSYKPRRDDFGMGSSIIASLLPRLYSLTLHVARDDFKKFQHACQALSLTLLPVQQQQQQQPLRYLDASIYGQTKNAVLSDFLPIDISSLQTLNLRDVHLPWLTGTPRNNLTNLTLSYSKHLPHLSHLLIFLSNCPLLNTLKLDISDQRTRASAFEPLISDVGATMNTADFHHLKHLILHSDGMHGYVYIWQFTVRIRAPVLFQFERFHKYTDLRRVNLDSRPLHASLNILETVPSGILSQFSDLGFLSIIIAADYGFEIKARHGPPSPAYRYDSNSLDVSGDTLEPFDHSLMIELIRTMPKLTHLRLSSSAWSIFASMSSDTEIRALLPCLHTLELSHCQKMEPFNSPLAYLKPNSYIGHT